eukprot:scaffold4400_cov124-Isochrysis_galbana.AAC.4
MTDPPTDDTKAREPDAPDPTDAKHRTAQQSVSWIAPIRYLPSLVVSAKVRRQPLHRVLEARGADLGVLRGVAHRSARR